MPNSKQLAVIAAARRDVGCAEFPPRSNGGRCVNALQGITGALNQAWCASAVSTWWFRGGLVERIVTAGTAELVRQARVKGWLTAEPIMGSAVVWNPGPSGHVELFIEWVDRARGIARTIGGNTGDAVREHFRDVDGAYFVTPPELREKPKPVYEDVYWWEDPAATPVRHQLRNTREAREEDIKEWVAKGGSPGHVRRGTVSIRRHGTTGGPSRASPPSAAVTAPRRSRGTGRGTSSGSAPGASRSTRRRS